MFAEAILGGLLAIFTIMLFALFGIFLMIFWIWMLIDAIKNKAISDGEKIGWVLAIVFFHFIGSLLYFFIARPKRA